MHAYLPCISAISPLYLPYISQAAEHAVHAAEKKAQAKVLAMSTTHSIRAIRRNYWWEKFFWFVSSENYIVVGGRDAQQNEQLVREIHGRCRGDIGEI